MGEKRNAVQNEGVSSEGAIVCHDTWITHRFTLCYLILLETLLDELNWRCVIMLFGIRQQYEFNTVGTVWNGDIGVDLIACHNRKPPEKTYCA